MPVIIIAGFLPMFFAAYAYRELNKVAPDCGTSFTWTTKAFGPYIGWLGGWAAILATVIVLSNLAGVAVQFFYQFLGDLVGHRRDRRPVGEPADQRAHLPGLHRARDLGRLPRHHHHRAGPDRAGDLPARRARHLRDRRRSPRPASPATGIAFDLDWFSPAGLTLSAFIAGLSGSIFAFWGWDTALTVNEESTDSDKTPGRAALLCVTSILLTYLLVAVALQMYAGVGDRGSRPRATRRSPTTSSVRSRGPVLGQPLDLVLFLAVLASSAASLITTFLPTSRTMLAMGTYRAFPRQVRDHPPRAQDPVLRHGGCRHRRRHVLRRAHLRQRARADRHDLLARHHDLLLLRADRVRVHLVLPPRAVPRLLQLRLQAALPAARAGWA